MPLSLLSEQKVLSILFIDRLNQKSTSQDEAVSVLRNTISVLDKEKDNLQETVDEKTERIACLDDNLANKVCALQVLLCSLGILTALGHCALITEPGHSSRQPRSSVFGLSQSKEQSANSRAFQCFP